MINILGKFPSFYSCVFELSITVLEIKTIFSVEMLDEEMPEGAYVSDENEEKQDEDAVKLNIDLTGVWDQPRPQIRVFFRNFEIFCQKPYFFLIFFCGTTQGKILCGIFKST